MTDIGRRMAAKLREKIAEHERTTRCGRIDMTLADYDVIGDHDAKILIEYNPSLGVPKMSQTGEWVTSTFNGHFRLAMESVRNHPEVSGITAIISENVPMAPAYRSASMVKLGAGRYIDAEKHQWEMKKNENGDDFLVRLGTDDMAAILDERMKRQRSNRYARITLTGLKTAGVASPDVGDRVVFFDQGLQQQGELVSVGKDNVKIKVRDDVKTVPRGNLIDVVAKSPEAKRKHDEELRKFWLECYGDEKFVSDLMKGKQ